MAICMLVEVVAAILWEFDWNTGDDAGPRQSILTARESHQTTTHSICKCLAWSWYSHSGAVTRGKAMRR